jgi:predicted transcriptional regulator of viral defense system
MYDWIAIAEARGNGLVFAQHVRELGVTLSSVRHAIEAGVLYRVRRGVLARPPLDSRHAVGERYRTLVLATAAVIAPDRVISHQSAAVIHGLPTIGALSHRVDTLAPDSDRHHASTSLIEHRTRVQPDTHIVDGVHVTSLARTLVDLASTTTLLVATVAIDAALRSQRVGREELFDELARVSPRYGYRKAAFAISFADARSANPGETLSRVRMHQLGFEAPDLQVHVSTSDGEYDVDFGWESVPAFGEFDGVEKYVREEMLNGESTAQAVLREKRREDAIRRTTQRTFARWGWADAWSSARLMRILDEAGVPRARGR